MCDGRSRKSDFKDDFWGKAHCKQCFVCARNSQESRIWIFFEQAWILDGI